MKAEQRHVLVGDLNDLEAAIAWYIHRWGQHLDGVHPDTTAGVPAAAANMAMSVVRKWIIGSWTEPNTAGAIHLHHERVKTLGVNDHRGEPQWGGPWDHELWATVGLPNGPEPAPLPQPSEANPTEQSGENRTP